MPIPLLVSPITVLTATGEGLPCRQKIHLGSAVLQQCLVGIQGKSVLYLLHFKFNPLLWKLDMAVTRAVSPSIDAEI